MSDTPRKRKTPAEQAADIDRQLAQLAERKKKIQQKLVAAERRKDTAEKVQLGVALSQYLQNLVTIQGYTPNQVIGFIKQVTDTYSKPLGRTDGTNLRDAVTKVIRTAQAQAKTQAATATNQEAPNVPN